jgi:hypothetical protein
MWLPLNHPFRLNSCDIDGRVERRPPPPILTRLRYWNMQLYMRLGNQMEGRRIVTHALSQE